MRFSNRHLLNACAASLACFSLTGCQPDASVDATARSTEQELSVALEETKQPAPEPGAAQSPEVAATETSGPEDAKSDDQVPLDTEAAQGNKQSAPAPTSLGIGDPAPPLAIDQWVMGKPINQLETGKVYVVEFWATWCPPCRTSMPHLSSLQESYADEVDIIGVTRENESVVAKFLDKEQSSDVKWSEVIKYRLALDSNDGTSNGYMRAAQQSGIPTAFIVGRDGIIEWIGHPMSMDRPLAQIVEGSWDRESAVAEFKTKQELKNLSRELSSLQRAGKNEEALEKLIEIEAQLGKSASLLSAKLRLLLATERLEEASQTRAEIVELAWDDAMPLNELAWNIAIGSDHRDLDLALRAAVRASELTKDENAAILDTLARVYYEQGNLAQAIEWQQKAVEHGAGNAEIASSLKKYLAEQEVEVE